MDMHHFGSNVHSIIVYGDVRRLMYKFLHIHKKEILKSIEVTELELFVSTLINLKEFILTGKKQVENENLSMIP